MVIIFLIVSVKIFLEKKYKNNFIVFIQLNALHCYENKLPICNLF